MPSTLAMDELYLDDYDDWLVDDRELDYDDRELDYDDRDEYDWGGDHLDYDPASSPHPTYGFVADEQRWCGELFGCGCPTCRAEYHRRSRLAWASIDQANADGQRPCEKPRNECPLAELDASLVAKIERWLSEWEALEAEKLADIPF